MNVQSSRQNSWGNKFRVAMRGALWAFGSQANFRIHLAVACGVIFAAAWFGATSIEWCLLTLCITMVLLAELLNTSLEHLARAITREHHPEIGHALDVAAGAVLIASLGAAVAGAILLSQIWLRHAGF